MVAAEKAATVFSAHEIAAVGHSDGTAVVDTSR